MMTKKDKKHPKIGCLFYFTNKIVKYATYINKYTIPLNLLILSLGGINGNIAKIIDDAINTLKSKLYEKLYVIGVINAETPIISKILKIFEPIIFPIAISLFPFTAAVTLVTNSG